MAAETAGRRRARLQGETLISQARTGSGSPTDAPARVDRHAAAIPRFLLHHRHEPHHCGAAYAAFRGHDTPLRHRATAASCRWGGHEVWWTVERAGAYQALALLPRFVAERTTVTRVDDVVIP
jgi:hypothetical protein